MSKELSPTMQAAVDYANQYGRTIIRYPGGFWAKEGWRGTRDISFGTSTVEALVTRGVAEYTKWQERKGGGQFPIEMRVTQ